MGKGGGGGASSLPMMFAMQAMQAAQKQTADLAKAMSDKPETPIPSATPELPTPAKLPATNTDDSKRKTTILTPTGIGATQPVTQTGGVLGSALTGLLGGPNTSLLTDQQQALKKKLGG